MGLPSTGSISMSQVNTELKKSATAVISLNDSDVRKLAGKSSGTISMGDLRGKKASESVTDYQIYSNSWSGEVSGNFTFNFPKKVIFGKIFAISKNSGFDEKMGSVTINGTKISSQGTTININSGTTTMSGTFFTGWNTSRPERLKITVDIKFTGEWEA